MFKTDVAVAKKINYKTDDSTAENVFGDRN